MAKYRDNINKVMDGGREVVINYTSRRWKDVVRLEKVVEGNWFNNKLIRRVGKRENTSFWNDILVDDVSLQVRFPRLYSISNPKD
jgi:hypothetical protein